MIVDVFSQFDDTAAADGDALLFSPLLMKNNEISLKIFTYRLFYASEPED